LCFDAQRKVAQRTVNFRVVDQTVGERHGYTWYERAKQPHLDSDPPRRSKYLGPAAIATGQLIRLSFPPLGVSAQGSAGNACGWLLFAHASMTAARENNRYDAANLDLHPLRIEKLTMMAITAR
jgi:hypothetical protein